VQCPDFYSDIELKSYALFQLFLQFSVCPSVWCSKRTPTFGYRVWSCIVRASFGHLLGKGGPMSEVQVEHSRLYAGLLFSRRLPRRKTHCSNWERCSERCQMMLPRDWDILNSRQHSTWMVVILHTVSLLSMYCSRVIRNNQNLWIWGLTSKCSNTTRVKISTWCAQCPTFSWNTQP